MKNTLLGILFLALCGMLAWKSAETGQLKQRIASLEVESATWKAAAKTPAVPEKAPDTAKVAAPAEGEAVAAAKPEEKKPEKMMKAMADMFKNDATKEMMKTQTKTVVEGMSKDLFELLNLDPETQAKLLDLMVADQLKNQELGMKAFSGGTKEEKASMFKDIAENHKASQEAIKALLKEPGQYEKYEKFQDSATERQQLTAIKSKMAGDGKPLDETQEQNLMNLLYNERKATKWDRDYTKQAEMSPDFFTSEALDRQAEQVKAYDAQIDAKLPTVLTPEQIESFKAQRTQQHAMEQMGVQFMKVMFADDSK